MNRRLALPLLLAFLLAGGCDAPLLSLPNAPVRFTHDVVLVSPGTITRIVLEDVTDPTGFELRIRGDAAHGAIRPLPEEFAPRIGAEIEALHAGEVDVELLYRGELLDTLHVEVVPFDRFALHPFQNLSPDDLPAIQSPFAVLTNRNVYLALRPLDASGRQLYDARELHGGLVTDDANVELELLWRQPRVRIATPGAHVLSMTLPEETIDVSLEAVAPEAVIGLQIEVTEREDGDAGISVTGVTAAGQHVVGVAPVLTIDGVEQTSTLGSWLFDAETLPERGTVEASWNGLMAAW